MCPFMAPRFTSTQRVYQTRERRRRGQSLATVRLDPIERQKLAALGYLDGSLLAAKKGPAIDAAVEAYLSNRLAAETL
jgi:hypothetical protein